MAAIQNNAPQPVPPPGPGNGQQQPQPRQRPENGRRGWLRSIFRPRNLIIAGALAYGAHQWGEAVNNRDTFKERAHYFVADTVWDMADLANLIYRGVSGATYYFYTVIPNFSLFSDPPDPKKQFLLICQPEHWQYDDVQRRHVKGLPPAHMAEIYTRMEHELLYGDGGQEQRARIQSIFNRGEYPVAFFAKRGGHYAIVLENRPDEARQNCQGDTGVVMERRTRIPRAAVQ